ncbi:MAG: ABC transporter ATP-binding protein [Pseudolabrys sp.]|jgi:ABC-type nitrate/sulfonate/bicarbonate transport system ATPase subunit
MTATATTGGKPLSLRGLAKNYASADGRVVEALLPVDLDIASGEFLVVVGPSGCGKSTMLNILAGLTPPSAGEARVGDVRVQGPDIDRGMVFQDYALFPWLDVSGNVEFGLERKGLPRRQRREVAMRYLEMVGLSEFADKRPRELSGGMKQRVAIARAFATEPSIIFMDEPFGALDALTRRHLQHELLRIWQEHRKTVVFITHSVVEAIYLSDRVVLMTARPGRVKTELAIDLPHPRDPTSDEFRALERRIYADLDEELAKSFRMEGRDTGG